MASDIYSAGKILDELLYVLFPFPPSPVCARGRSACRLRVRGADERSRRMTCALHLEQPKPCCYVSTVRCEPRGRFLTVEGFAAEICQRALGSPSRRSRGLWCASCGGLHKACAAQRPARGRRLCALVRSSIPWANPSTDLHVWHLEASNNMLTLTRAHLF